MEDIHLLKQSFDAFQQSSARLQEVYDALQEKIAQAAVELEAKNAELSRISAEREDMKNYLQSILENLTAGVLVTDHQGLVKIANHAAQNFLLASEDELKGTHISQIFGDPEPEEGKNVPPGDFEAGSGRRLTLNGRVLEIFSSPMTTSKGDPGGSAWVIYDMTGTLKLEKQARHLEKNAAMLEMAARIAHEVRNPLGSIELFSSLLLRHIREPKQRDWVDQIIHSVKNIDQKIEELLRHAKTVEPLMEMMNVHDILKELLLYSDRIADQGHVFLSVEYDGQEPVIRGNPVMLRQIFMGLVLNALKSLPDQGRICIRTKIEDNGTGEPSVRISFSDNRTENPGDPMQRFFNPDQDDERLASFNFAVIQNIVAMHKGSLHAENGPDGTTSFSIVFPLVKP
jgi:signal transduction histidine kinase